MAISCTTTPTLTTTHVFTSDSVSTSFSESVTTIPGATTVITSETCVSSSTIASDTVITCLATSTILSTSTADPTQSTTSIPIITTIPVTSTSVETLFGTSCTTKQTPDPDPGPTNSPPPSPTPSNPVPSPSPSPSNSLSPSVSPSITASSSASSSDPSSPTPGTTQDDGGKSTRGGTGAIIGGALGGFFGLIAIVALIWFVIRRRRRWDDIFEKDIDVTLPPTRRKRFSLDIDDAPKPYQYGLVGHVQPPSPPPSSTTFGTNVQGAPGEARFHDPFASNPASAAVSSAAPLITPGVVGAHSTSVSSRPSTAGSMDPLRPSAAGQRSTSVASQYAQRKISFDASSETRLLAGTGSSHSPAPSLSFSSAANHNPSKFAPLTPTSQYANTSASAYTTPPTSLANATSFTSHHTNNNAGSDSWTAFLDSTLYPERSGSPTSFQEQPRKLQVANAGTFSPTASVFGDDTGPGGNSFTVDGGPRAFSSLPMGGGMSAGPGPGEGDAGLSSSAAAAASAAASSSATSKRASVQNTKQRKSSR